MDQGLQLSQWHNQWHSTDPKHVTSLLCFLRGQCGPTAPCSSEGAWKVCAEPGQGPEHHHDKVGEEQDAGQPAVSGGWSGGRLESCRRPSGWRIREGATQAEGRELGPRQAEGRVSAQSQAGGLRSPAHCELEEGGSELPWQNLHPCQTRAWVSLLAHVPSGEGFPAGWSGRLLTRGMGPTTPSLRAIGKVIWTQMRHCS